MEAGGGEFASAAAELENLVLAGQTSDGRRAVSAAGDDLCGANNGAGAATVGGAGTGGESPYCRDVLFCCGIGSDFIGVNIEEASE